MNTKKYRENRLKRFVQSFVCLCFLSTTLSAEVLRLDETCTISILNRSVQAAVDGSWSLNNIPSFMGQVRARATCVSDGKTISGQTEFFTILQNGDVEVSTFETIDEEVTPVSLDFATGNNTVLYGEQTYFRLRVLANYADGSREDITRITNGINYTISNPAIAQIDANGVLQGISSGRVLITARKDGTSASLSVTIVTTGDSDEDGLPDDFETENGLNPNDPIDAAEDSDSDGLSALEEYLAGTDVNNPDSDGDTIKDGEESIVGADGFVTNPLLSDSDSDGISDNLELAVGTDPTDISSVNFGASIAGIDVNPDNVVLTFNSIQGADASVQLNVNGTTLDGESIDLTALSKGTNYNSSDTNVCNFGGRAGEVFAGNNGDCVVTADNSGFSDTSDIAVQSYDPLPLNFMLRDDQPRALDVEKGFAYIGTNDGLQIVDVTNPQSMVERGFVSLGTNVNDVKVKGNYAYLATATVALVVVDISDPAAPVTIASLGATTASSDLALSRNELYIAAQEDGLWVVNIANPLIPRQVNVFQANTSINAVAVSSSGQKLVLADSRQLRLITRQGSGLFTENGSVNLSNPQNIIIENNVAYVADLSTSLTLVDISDAKNPQVTATLPFSNTGRPRDIALAGKFAFLADTSFTNGVPIVDVLDMNAPASRAVIDFTQIGMAGADGYSIDVDNQFIYVVTSLGLQVGQYQQFVDENNIPPEITITQPLIGDSALEGGVINVVTEAFDDVAIATVSFYADGELLYTDIAAPYEHLMPLPIAKSSTEISVIALDYGNDESTVASVTVNLLADSDYDGLSDVDEINIHGTSPFAADSDDDGLDDPTEINLGYNPLDEDMDNDGLLDGEELSPGTDGYITNPYDPDSDNDSMPDGFESRYGLNPLSASDAILDPDEDGLSNLEEFRLGFDPTSADSDQDGMPDEYERQFGLDPLNPNDFFGDLDNDGVPNGVEFNEGTDPTNPDVTGPEVVSQIPASPTELPANASVLVRFNEQLKNESLSEITAFMSPADDSSIILEGIVTLSTDGYILVFNPVLNLQINTQYNLNISGAKDIAGNPMVVAYNTEISSGELADNTGPNQLAINPFNNSDDVPVNTVLTLYFDEAIDPTILNDTNFYLVERLLNQHDRLLNQYVRGGVGVSDDGKQLFFIPSNGLLVGRDYYLYISNIRDLSGNQCSNCASSQYIYFNTAFTSDEIAPKILTSSIVDGSTAVPLNARFVINLDEPLGPVFMENIQLLNNSLETTIAYTISSDRRQVTIRPSALLLANASYELSISELKDLSNNVATPVLWNFTTAAEADLLAGSLLRWSIPSGATDVALNPLLEITLSERLDPTSISSRSFYLYDSTENRDVAGTWQLSGEGRVLQFIPDDLLEPDHRYYLYVGRSPYFRDLAGNVVGQNGSHYFNTGGTVDETSPIISLTSIAADQIDVPVNGRIVVQMDEQIGDGCQSEAVLTSSGSDIAMIISIATDRKTLTLTPVESLSSSTVYNLSLSNLCDYSGNPYTASDTLRFTTSATGDDTTAPTLVSITPTHNATDVAVSSTVVMVFNEPIDQTSHPVVKAGSLTVLGDYNVSGNTVTFTPDTNLQGDTQYRVDLVYSIADLAGNTAYLGYQYFTTEAVIDNDTPSLAAISPVADAVGINPGVSIRLTFSEPMNPSTVNSNNIALFANGTVIRPSVYRSADGQQVSLTANIPSSSIVSVILTEGLQDLSGNALPPVASSFTTGVIDTDNSRPSVAQQIPTNGSSGLFNVDQIVLVMNEPMDASSIASSMHIAMDGVLVDGTIDVLSDNQTLRFTANETFTEGAYVQVFLESLATDDSGNAAYDYSGYFRMGSTDELIGTRAYPTAYSPQTEVALNPLIMVRYNEPLDPAALNSAVIDLQVDATNVSVGLDVSLDSTGYILQISPQTLLAPNTVYELRLDDIVDSDGDTNTYFYSPEFTTGSDAVEDNRQPVVLAMSPPNGAIDVGLNGNYSVRFDERMNPISFDTLNSQLINVQFSEDNQVVRYDYQGTLEPSTEVTETVPAMVDVSGNEVVSVSSTFTTSASPDFTRPVATGSVSGTVSTNPVIAWVFNEAIDPVSVTSSGVYLRDSVTGLHVPVTISLSVDGKRLDIVPTEVLSVGRSYSYYANYVRDLSGNSYSVGASFTTSFDEDTTAPQVLDATVFDGQIEVPTNTRFNVRFDEPLSNLITLGVSLTDAGADPQNIEISFNSDRTIMTVTPQQLLLGDAAYTLTVSGMEDIAGNAQVTPLIVSFTTGRTADLLTGIKTAWSIPNRATDVALNPLLEITLSERIDPTSISSSSFYLRDSTESRNVAGTWQLSGEGRVLQFIPDDLLEPDHRYYLYVGRSPYFRDLAGNVVGQNGSHYFNTGGTVDETSPIISLTSIAADQIDVPVNGRIVVQMDEQIGDGCQSEAVLTSSGSDIAMIISIATDRKTLTLTPVESLSSSTVYNLSLSNLCDYSGNPYTASDTLRFTTSATGDDTTAPTLVSITPTHNATDVAVSSTVVMVFNEPIDQTSRPVVKAGNLTVLGDYTVSGNTITFTPDADFQGDTQYRVNLVYSSQVHDLVGNTLSIGYRYFTTVTQADIIAPSLSVISPVADAVGINPGVSIRLTFSEPMNPSTVNSNNIALFANGTVIRPSVYRSADGQQVSLTANMPSSSIVSVILTEGLQDLSGNALPPVASSFTTGVIDTDNSRPSVAQQIPTNGSSGLFNVDQIVLVMNEPMDASSIASSMHIAMDGVLVDGTIDVLSDNQTLRFTANETFTEGAYVQVFLESLATDDSGNAAYDYSGYFRMGSTDELIGTRAYPTAYSPYSNQTEVALNPLIMVRYNEPLDPAALNSAVIDLQVDATNVSVGLDVSLDSTGYILQISPQTLLAPNTVYELRLDDIVDSDGDTNTSFYSPEFTTGSDAVEDNRQPVVLAMSPPNGAIDVGLNGNYSVRFDERMNPISFDTLNSQLINVQFSKDNQVVRYDYQGTLEPSTEVTETVPAMVDVSGNEVVSVSSTFTTSASPDFTAPVATGSVSGTVSTNPVIAWVFNEPVDPVSMTSSGVYLYDTVTRSNVPVTISLSTDGKRLDIVPTEALAVGRAYYYYAHNIRDFSGNTSSRSAIFTTSFYEDTTAPQVLDSTVFDGQIEVPTNTRFNVRFDEPLSNLITLGVSLTDAGADPQNIEISFNSDRTIMTVTPQQLLLGDAAYTLTVSGMEDIAGNAQVTPLIVSFTTGRTADLLTGIRTAWSIPNRATDVALNPLLEITLSERLDPTSISSRSFYLYDSTENRDVAGTWQLSGEGRVLQFIPDELLEADHRYYLYVGRSLYFRDLAGNAVGRNGSRYFNTVN